MTKLAERLTLHASAAVEGRADVPLDGVVADELVTDEILVMQRRNIIMVGKCVTVTLVMWRDAD